MTPVPTQKRLSPQGRRELRYHYKSERYTNRQLLEVLPDGAWAGKPCFIIGGGPSLKDFNWSLLKGHRTIGVNRVFEKFDPTIIFSMDTRYLRWILDGKYGAEAKQKFDKSKAYKCWLCTYRASLPAEVFIVKVFRNYTKGFKAFKTSQAEGIGHGNNSGYAAINLAVCLGARPIYLVGFDMSHEKNRTHWHDGHPRPQTQLVIDNFIRHFNNALPAIKKTGAEIINLNPESGLKCFPRRPLKEVLN